MENSQANFYNFSPMYFEKNNCPTDWQLRKNNKSNLSTETMALLDSMEAIYFTSRIQKV